MRSAYLVFSLTSLAAAATILLGSREKRAPAATPEKLSFFPFSQDCDSEVKLNFFGDIYITPDKVKVTPKLFDNVRPLLRWADFNIANFEGNVTEADERAFPDFPFALKMSSHVPELLAREGIKNVTRANNHSMDYGVQGMLETSHALEKNHIEWAGVGNNLDDSYQPMIIEAKGTRIAVVSLNMTYPKGAWATDSSPGVAYPILSSLKKSFAATRTANDVVIVMFHWGEELAARPRSYQPEMASLLIKWGADAVFGAHAHVAQGATTINGKPVGYGLGNFLFSALSENAQFGLAAHVQICPGKNDNRRTLQVVYTPLDTHNGRTGYATRPMPTQLFKKLVLPYVKNKFFDMDTMFYLNDAKKARPLSEWVQRLHLNVE